jgi:two-component system, sensor histidine kinase
MSERVSFDLCRLEALLAGLERMAGGETDVRLPISDGYDALDAIAYGTMVVEGERRFANDQLRVAKEEAERANQAKSVFLRNMSHEIRTPIAAIVGLSAMLADPGMSELERGELVGRIRKNGDALLRLVEDVLDLSKVESGRLRFDTETVSPLEVLADVLKSLEPETRAKGLRITVSAPGGGIEPIGSDRARLRQILLNVVGNAVKFTDIGEIRVAANIEGKGTSRWVTVDVTDTGIGIGAQERLTLFQAFMQAPGGQHRYGGAGLGLMLSKRLAQGLGGDLSLRSSSPGQGSTFRVAIAAPPPPTPAAIDSAAAAPRPLAGKHVLVAEDNSDISFAIVRLLELQGARVVLAIDGHEAIDKAKAERFDAVIMDVRMPGLDGLEATRRLRMAGHRMPILALTADAVPEQRAECLAAGCDDYLSKPFDPDKLIEAVRRHIRV